MGDGPFRRKPYLDADIDTLKVVLMIVLFLAFVLALLPAR
jgi:hypothetical protein